MNGHRPEHLFAVVAMLTDCIEALNPWSISVKTPTAAVLEFQKACAKTGACLQKLQEAARRDGR